MESPRELSNANFVPLSNDISFNSPPPLVDASPSPKFGPRSRNSSDSSLEGVKVDLRASQFSPAAKKARRIDTRRFPSARGTIIDLDIILSGTPTASRKSKVVCTLGLQTSEVAALKDMLLAGLNIARLNFSHGDHVSHGKAIRNIRAACQETGLTCAIMLDTKGPEIRTGLLVNHQPVDIAAGQMVKLVTDYTHLGDGNTIAVSYKNLPKKVSIGSPILVADGSLSLVVREIFDDHVICSANNSIRLGEKKNMNLPGADVDIETITEKDRADLTFGTEQGVDMVAASFVRSAEDISVIRDALGPNGKDIKIIAKIENQQGLKNFDDILAAADGIMVARGDLGMEIPPQKVFLAQKMMITKCNLAGKPVITATQMLESMIKNPRPTRAEATDVANAVIDGTDCVMLSGETASGDYPLQAIDIMTSICLEAERAIDYNSLYLELREAASKQTLSTEESLASASVSLAISLAASIIVVIDKDGAVSRKVSKYSPQSPILSVVESPQAARQLLLNFGVVPVLASALLESAGAEADVPVAALEWAKKKGLCSAGSFAVLINKDNGVQIMSIP